MRVTCPGISDHELRERLTCTRRTYDSDVHRAGMVSVAPCPAGLQCKRHHPSDHKANIACRKDVATWGFTGLSTTGACRTHDPVATHASLKETGATVHDWNPHSTFQQDSPLQERRDSRAFLPARFMSPLVASDTMSGDLEVF
jgi:hypothetical protein